MLAREFDPSVFALYPWWVATIPFGLINSLPFIIGFMIFTTKQNNLIQILLILLFIIVVLYTGFFTPLLFTITIVGVSLMIRFGIKRLYMVLFMVLIISSVSIYKLELLNLAKFIPNETVQFKVRGLEEKATYGEGNASVESRENLYLLSLDVFLNNIFIGQGDVLKVGGHSYWLDKLALYGILGTLPYFFFFFTMYKRSLILLNTRLHYLFKIQVIITFLFMFANPYEFLDYFTTIFIFSVAIGNYVLSQKKTKLTYRAKLQTYKA